MSRLHAILGKDTTLTRAGNQVMEIVNIKPPSMTGETKDVTTMDTTNMFREFIAGLRDGGEASMAVKFYPGDTLGQYGLYEDYSDGIVQTFIITLPNSVATWTFVGIVTAYTGDIPLDDAVGAEIKIKITGKPTIGVTASTGWSAFVLRDITDSADATALSITPAIAAAVVKYVVTYTTETSLILKATAASHTLMAYVDDVFLEELTTAVAGSVAIAFTAGQVKKVTIIAWEDDKQPYAYQLMVARTS